MKKIHKVLIAFIVIASLTVVAFFVLNKENKNSFLHKYMNELNYNIKNEDKNVIYEVNSAINEMIAIIDENNIDIVEQKAYLQKIADEIEMYSLIEKIVLNYGNVINDNKNDQIVSKYVDAFNNLKELYNKGYKYLKDTYFKINSNGYSHIGTMTSYIKNFVVIFNGADVAINGFYYNAGLLFANGTKNISDINNQIKLEIAYLAELNNIYFSKDETVDLSQIKTASNLMESKINTAQLNDYLNNKVIIDNLINNIEKLNLSELALGCSTNKEEYLNTINDLEIKELSQNFVDLIVEA